MIKEAIARVINGHDLSADEMETAMGEVFDGRASATQTATLVTALRLKGETVAEITGAARALRARALKLSSGNHLVTIDRDDINVEGETILETSEDGDNGTMTFNISTATIFVIAGGGIRVARHGNRAASLFFGAADVLANLGVNVDLSTSEVERSLAETGIGFFFTPLLEGPMRSVARLREEMGIRTIFNLIGPLTNPAGAATHVLGVYAPSLTAKMAQVLLNLGAREAFVVYGEGTQDEISICGPTTVSRLKDGRVETFTVAPEDFGLDRSPLEALRGGNAAANARIIREVLDGRVGPPRDVVVLNAAAAFVAAGLDADLAAGIERAAEVIDSGKAKERLATLASFTAGCAPFVRKIF